MSGHHPYTNRARPRPRGRHDPSRRDASPRWWTRLSAWWASGHPVARTATAGALLIAWEVAAAGGALLVLACIQAATSPSDTRLVDLWPLALPAASAMVLAAGMTAIVRRTHRDRRRRLQARLQWALDWATTPDHTPVAPQRRRVAQRMLQALAASPLAGPDERDLVAAILASSPRETSRPSRLDAPHPLVGGPRPPEHASQQQPPRAVPVQEPAPTWRPTDQAPGRSEDPQ